MRFSAGRTAMARRLRWSGALVLLLASNTVAHAEKPPPCELARGDVRAVARVADGETLVLDDGRRLRLIGMLAPRAGDVGAVPESWPPENDSRAALAVLVAGRSIVMWHDGTRLDRYGQVLAQVMVGAEWVQGALVARGLARAYGRPGLDACSEALGRIERQARADRLGLWVNPAYQTRDAGKHADVIRATGSFQVLSGTVHRASRGKGGVYLSLSPRRGRDAPYALAAVVPGSRTELTGGVEARALVGRQVLVRGWIEQRRGPVIVIDSKGQFELVDD